MKLIEALKTAWRRTLDWIDSREPGADKGLRDLADADWTARAIYGGIVLVVTVGLILVLVRCSGQS